MRLRPLLLPLPLLLLCAAPGRGVFEGTCPRKDPPAGVLVVAPGSHVLLSCGGIVKVDGSKVSIRAERWPGNRGKSADRRTTDSGGEDWADDPSRTLEKRGENATDRNRTQRHHGPPAVPVKMEHTDSQAVSRGAKMSPDSHTFLPATAGPQAEDGRDEMVTEIIDDGQEEEAGGTVTKGLRRRPQWKLDGQILVDGDTQQGRLVFGQDGTTLSLTSAELGDSGRYTCQHQGQGVTLKVIVAAPPKRPTLSCSKKSPSSKIHCHWMLSLPVNVRPQCLLFLSKSSHWTFSSSHWTFSSSQCSFSASQSRCWCSLDHNEDEKKILHMAYLCVTSTAGNATSSLLSFTPLGILKPDPPKDVRVRQVEGHERWMTVSWSLPASWKSRDQHYELIFEIRYIPSEALSHLWQTEPVEGLRSFTITDALPGAQYSIQLRTKDEYDGLWSVWSAPVYGHSWTARKSVPLNDDLTTTHYSFYGNEDGSSSEDNILEAAPEPVSAAVEVWHHVLWVCATCLLLFILVAVFIFRHRAKVVTQIQTLTGVIQCSTAPPAPPQAAAEAQALVTFGPLPHKQPQHKEEENVDTEPSETSGVEERKEAINFNNASYFLVYRER